MVDLVPLLVASAGFGAAGEGVRRYRGWKRKRRLTPAHERNTGFWTDSRIYHAEWFGVAAALAGPWSAALILTVPGRPIWVAVLMLLAYTLATYLIVYGLNAPER